MVKLSPQEARLVNYDDDIKWADQYEAEILRAAMREQAGEKGSIVEELTRRVMQAAKEVSNGRSR